MFPYVATTTNLDTIYCGPREYTLGGDGSSQPAWLTFDQLAGTLSVQTDDISFINFSPGYSVKLKACLKYYPGQCSTDVTFNIVIQQCVPLTLTSSATQGDIIQQIFGAAVTQPVVSYVQAPDCGYVIQYKASIVAIVLPYSGTATVSQAVTTGHPAWVLAFDSTSASPHWSVRSTDNTDSTIFTINQSAYIDYTQDGLAKQLVVSSTFTVNFQDPCKDSSIVPMNGPGQIFDSASTVPLIRTSVKFGTDTGGPGTKINQVFEFHHDTVSDNFNVGSNDSSNWVCGPRTYVVTVDALSSAAFMSVADSPTVSTLTKPILSALTSQDIHRGVWLVSLQVSLTRYPLVIATEKFYVQIDQCILNQLTEDLSTKIMSPFNNPTVFEIYSQVTKQLKIPTYIQVPACGYQLSYTLSQIETWDSKLQIYDTTPRTSTFATLDNPTNPVNINLDSQTPSDDQCKYSSSNPTVCNPTDSHPYLLRLNAYIDPSLIIGVTFPVSSNIQEQFYVYPQDPCHSTTLVTSTVGSVIYFLGDVAYKIKNLVTTNDTVSLDATSKYLVDFSGHDKCGERSYQLFTPAMSTPAFASVPINSEPPIITIKSSNAALVGIQQVKLLSSLVDYPHIQASADFTVTIYNFKIGKEILPQYYQITKQNLTLTWASFTISPTPSPANSMPIIYTMPDVIEQKNGIYITPDWLIVDTNKRTLNIYTNKIYDQGVYQIVIYGQVLGQNGKPIIRNQTVTLNITRTAPPPLSTTPPNFTLPLVNQEFKMGEEFSWTLPPTQSVGNFAVKVTLSQGPKWLAFDSKTLTFTVKKGGTKLTDTGDFTLMITLQDQAGGKSTSTQKLTCIAPPVVIPQFVNTSAPAAYPVPKITKITNKGQVTVVWDQQMRIPRNLTQVSNGTCNYVNPSTFEIERQPKLEVYIIRGQGDEGKELSFLWNFTSWDTKAMTIQLQFTSPADVSYGPDPEKLRLTFYDMSQFISQSGIPVNGGRNPNKNSIPIFKIPPQVNLHEVVAVRRNNKAGMTSSQIGPMIMQLSISSLLNSVWGMVDTQQIIILLPLFDIALPENAANFFAQLMTIAAFAIIPTDPIFGFLLDAPPANLPLPLSDNFMAVGFATTYISNNMGTLFFSLMYFPVMACVYLILKKIPNEKIMSRRIGLGRKLFWSNTFQTFSDQYTIIATCALIQIAYLDWNTNYGTVFCSVLGCVYTVIAIALPFVVAFICWKNFDLIKSGDKAFKQRFGSMWSGLSTEDRGFIVYHWYFLLRRFIIGVLCVFSRKTLFFQIAGLVFNIIFGTIIAGNTLCMVDARLNTIEYFNETMIMLVMYCLICFTDFGPDPNTKSQIGVVCESLVIFHIVFNLSFLFGDYAMNLKLRYKRWAMFRKYAKFRAVKNYKLQKQLRHQRFVNHIKRNEAIQAAIEKKKLHQIQEESNEESDGSYSISSYEYAEEQQVQENISNNSKIENSEQDLEYGNHFTITKAIARQPAEAPEIKLKRFKEFHDGATTSDYKLHSKLGLVKPVEYPMDMERQVQKNLVRRIPYDSIYPDIQKIMNEGEEEEDKSYANKLKRRLIENPLELEYMEPLRLVHNKLARMVQHDVTESKNKIKPIDYNNQQLRILADQDGIHKKLFKRMETGDGQQTSGSEAFKNSKNGLLNRRLIITKEKALNYKITEDTSGTYYGQDGKRIMEVPAFKPTVTHKLSKQLPNQVTKDQLEDLIEEEKQIQVDNHRLGEETRQQQMEKLIKELFVEETIDPDRKLAKPVKEGSLAHTTHLKLFGSGVGRSLKLLNPQPSSPHNWDVYEVHSKLFNTPAAYSSDLKLKDTVNDRIEEELD